MFDALFNALGGTLGGITRMNHPFVNEARAHWQHNPGAATLWCRWYWEHIPPEVVPYAAQFAQQARATLDGARMNDEVNARLGALGIAPSYAPALGGGYVGDPNEAILMITLANIRSSSGNPPADPRVGPLAERVLCNQMQPLELLRATLPAEQRAMFDSAISALAGFGSFGAVFGSPLGDFASMLNLMGTLTAALALPRARIPHLLGLKES